MPDYSSPKYPRTPHFSFSPGATKDDKIQRDLSSLLGQNIVALEKMDGSNSCLEKQGVFARTHAHSPTHPSFDHLKAFHQSVKWKMNDHVQYFGENLYATHSIAYSELPGYFLLFGVRDLSDLEDDGSWLQWDLVEDYAAGIGVPTVPVLWTGKAPKTEKDLQKLVEEMASGPSKCGGEKEGVVVRVAREFGDEEFGKCVLKFVRANHVSTGDHWALEEMKRNKLLKA